MPEFTPENLERFMQILKDIKKEIHYCKSTGGWDWCDRDEPLDSKYEFATFWECLCDAVGPYIEDSE